MKAHIYSLLTIFIILSTTCYAEEITLTNNTTPTPDSASTNNHSSKMVPSFVYDRTVQGEMDEVYKKVFTALENNSYFVILEPNLGKNLSYFSKRWGDDYNQNKLESIRSMVFCSAWYANKISNIDPAMLALCPLRITLYTKNNETHILFIRPGRVAANSPAQKTAKELEDDIIRTIEVAITS